MIPEFPQFKKLELSDKKEIEEITLKFPPYSDFNFVSMWCWDTKGETRVSKLNNNLIIRFTDYTTDQQFYSFLGDEKENESILELFSFLKKENLPQALRLISEEIGHNLIKSNLEFISDKDSNDYIYHVPHIADMHNWPKHTFSRNIKNFLKAHPNHIVKQCLLRESSKEECLEVFRQWAQNKEIENYIELNEFKALERIFDLNYENIFIILIYIDEKLVGFNIYETLSQNYAISHFAKADTTYHVALSNILNWEEAKALELRGIKYVNWEQDLGIIGLRLSKEKHEPSFLFRKIIINNKN